MESIWTSTCQISPRERLRGELSAEAAVIGGGMAGILIAHRLQKAGKQVVVLEANRIAGGQTRNTTAKVTAQHGMIYHKLIESLGEEKARMYVLANLEAVRQYRELIAREGISCDWEDETAYVYSDDRNRLVKEAEAYQTLGIPGALLETVPIPIPNKGALAMEGQGRFHPLKLLKALAEPLTVYEQTPVRTVEGHTVTTDHGKVGAETIVFASHYPFVNFPGLYFARMHQERSYVLALEGAPKCSGIWLGEGKNAYSLRQQGDLLLFGGESHRTGENSQGGRYHALRTKAREWFPHSREVAHWSAQDCITPDSVPYIGSYAASQPDWYVATGFQKWGMTGSMVSAMILSDRICGKENPYAPVFDPGRFPAENLSGIAKESGQAVKGLIRRVFQIPQETVNQLPSGHGGIVELRGEKVGVYKGEDGALFAVDIRCPHLGCQLEWNPDEKSWDCPCHGSRFDIRGNLISGPAQENLAPLERAGEESASES